MPPYPTSAKKKRQAINDITLPTEMPDDSEDDDFDPNAVHASPSKRKTRTGSKAPPGKKRGKNAGRRKRKNDYDDDGLASDDLDLDFSGKEMTDDEDEESEEELNTAGHPRRSAARKRISYREDTEEEEEEAVSTGVDSDEDVKPKTRGKVNTLPTKLVVKLKISPQKLRTYSSTAQAARKAPPVAMSISPESNKRQTRAQSARATSAVPTTPTVMTRRNSRTRQTSVEPTRKSARIRHSEEPLQELTNSGHAREAHTTPKMPSVVFEESEHSSIEHKEIKDVKMDDDEEDEQVEKVAGSVEGEQEQDQEPDADADADAELDAEATLEQPEEAAAQEAPEEAEENDEEDEEDGIRTRSSRRRLTQQVTVKEPTPQPEPEKEAGRRLTRSALTRQDSKKKDSADDDEYEESGESSDDASDSDVSTGGSQKKLRPEDDGEEYEPGGRATRGSRRSPRKRQHSGSDEDLDEEVYELLEGQGKRRRSKRPRGGLDEPASRRGLRQRAPINYSIIPPAGTGFDDLQSAIDGQASQPATSTGPKFNLFQTAGPFGGLTESRPLLGPTSNYGRVGLAAGADSDSSDDERPIRPLSMNLMSPTQAREGAGIDSLGNPNNMGKVRPKGALTTDSDPLGVDQNISFESVGGLEDHINQLKDMVFLPLMYPELFAKFGTTPPKGVLFHGPPGTGKTLLARALAASCSTEGRKITFFMRKGADVMSKWVGEAERQLRMLFEEAKNCQPSIIFFDEIDGLAPVRSSKQEQIHASIVATLLALMDGMDGRGQIIVIGATNRPDSVDPALRRPGRFDREFYFPLPDVKARRHIINIHTKNWDPPLSDKFKDTLAEMTKGYGGADIRALCTEAALNAIQRKYPQIYQSKDKLLLDLNSIQITSRDFLISLKKMIPSSERSTSSAGAPLPQHIGPLLEKPFEEIKKRLKTMIPEQRKMTALEEAMYEDDGDPESGFQKEMLLREFESSRIFRPRLLIHGLPGMGQTYVGPAILHQFEGYFVQNFDLASLMGDSGTSAESQLIQKFTEVKRHKPSVIYIPNLDVWTMTLRESPTLHTFTGLLRSIPPNDPILVLGVLEGDVQELEVGFVQELFGFSSNNRYELKRPGTEDRAKYFENIKEQIRKSPKEFPDPLNRKKRELPKLPLAPPPPPKVVTDEELKALERADRNTLYLMQTRLRPLVDSWKQGGKYRKLRKPVVEAERIKHLFEPQDPDNPFEIASPFTLVDENGEKMILDTSTNKKVYNIDLDTIEHRFANGFYHMPKMMLDDLMRLAHDAKVSGDRDRLLRSSELLAHAEVFIHNPIELPPDLIQDCERVHARAVLREIRHREKKERRQKEREEREAAAAALARDIETRAREIAGDVEMVDAEADPSSALVVANPQAASTHLSNGSQANGTEVAVTTRVTTIATHVQTTQTLINSSPASNAATQGSSMDGQSSAYHTAPPPSDSNSRDENSGSHFTPSIHQSQVTTGTSQNTSQATASTHELAERVHPAHMANIAAILNNDNSPGNKKLSVGSTSSTSFLANTSSYTNTTTPSHGPGRESLDGLSQSGFLGNPDFSGFLNSSGDSQHPDTQSGSGSGGTSVPSSQSQRQSLPQNALPTPASDPHPPLILTPALLEQVHSTLVDATGNFSIEQIEQVKTAVMRVLWETRGEWDRDAVCRKVLETVKETTIDIKMMQGVGVGSRGRVSLA